MAELLKRIMLIVILFVWSGIVGQASDGDDAYSRYLQTLKPDTDATYYLVLPTGYDKAKQYPMVVSLHGAGEKGSRMVRYWIDAAKEKDMILCCPNSTGFSWSQTDMLRTLKIVEQVLLSYSIDKEKILLTGVSAGGALTYFMGFTLPVMFPYINPMSSTFNGDFLNLAKKAERIPIYITHGAKDDVIPPAKGGDPAAEELKKLGFDVTYILRPEDGHEVPEGEQLNILEWFQNKCNEAKERKN